MTRYEKGFIEKCAEYGVDGEALLKQATVLGGPKPPSGMLGASAGSPNKNGILNTLLTVGKVMPSGTHVKATPFGLMPATVGEVSAHRSKTLSTLLANTGIAGNQGLKRRLGLGTMS